MSELFANGHIIDLILGLVLLEAILMLAYWRTARRGVAPTEFFSNLLSGIFLMLALRGALVSAWWGWIALCLSVALLAHLADLRRRWQDPPLVGPQ